MKLGPYFPKVSPSPTNSAASWEQSIEAQDFMKDVSHSIHSATLETN